MGSALFLFFCLNLKLSQKNLEKDAAPVKKPL